MRSISLFTFLILITSFSFPQSSSWKWGRELTQTTPRILHIDRVNTIYGVIPYQKSIAIGDTFFTHNYYQEPQANCALFTYESSGDFLQAFDLHTIEKQSVEVVSVITDNLLNSYVAGSFRVRLIADDTIMNHGCVPYIKYPEGFLLNLKPDLRLNLALINSGFGYDYSVGLEMTPEQDLILATLHTGNLNSTKVILLGQDTLTFQNNIVTICRTDLYGQIKWTKIVSFLENSVSDLRLISGGDGSYFLIGKNVSGIIVGKDTVINPYTPSFNSMSFLIKVEGDGHITESQFLPLDLYLTDFAVSPGGSRYYSGYFYNTAVIAGDTITLPSDTVGSVIIQTDSLNQVTWFKLIKFHYPAQHIFTFRLAEFLDSLYFSSYCTGTFLFDGEPIQTGDSAYLITGSLDPDGIVNWINLNGPSLDLNPFDLLADNCGNLILGGIVRGLVIFGDDTIQTSGSNSMGFLSRMELSEIPSSGLSDTSLYFQDSLILIIDVPYDRYLWSTGDTTSTIIVKGSSMNPGTHLFWIRMTNGLCTACDTFYITMKYHPGYEEYQGSQILLFPNPAETSITVLVEPPILDVASIDIWNIQGILVGRSEGSGRKMLLDISDYPAGIYVVRIRGERCTYTGKFCKK
ncbi:MAG: T9SS type A sorting domain-containing protein [Bacteroidales bacterium]|nr:T9SS type A sorting domain-containing protein [Bacteroidales bacterium]